jgi:RNA polymerase sigma factor (sigma-70 family)
LEKLTAENSIRLKAEIINQKGRLYNFIKRFVPSREEAEDILQDVLYKFVMNFESFQLMDRASSWLIHVAKNRIIDSRRKMKPGLIQDLAKLASDEDEDMSISMDNLIPDLSSLPDEIYWRGQIWNEIQYALEDMPDKQREIFELTEFEGLTFREISEMKNVPLSTLLSRKKYAVLFLRKRLKYLYEELKKDV